MSKLAEELRTKRPELAGPMRLKNEAYEALKAANRNPAVAHDSFVEKIIIDAAMLVTLIGISEIRNRAFQYLRDSRADMVRFGSAQQTDGDKGFGSRDALEGVALSPSTPLPGKGQQNHAAHHSIAQPRQPYEGGGGQEQLGTRDTNASPPSPHDSRSGQGPCATQLAIARSAVTPKPIPLPNRGVTAMASIQGIMAKNIVFRLHDGRDIMDAQFHELSKIEANGVKVASQFVREAMVAKYLRENVAYANPDPFARIGDLYPQKMIDLALQFADTKEPAHV